MKSIEERLMDSHEQRKALREIFEAYTDPRHTFWGLLEVLGSIQKEFGADWKEHVIACMYGMELHDAGLFPAEWFPDDDDSLEAYNNARMRNSR